MLTRLKVKLNRFLTGGRLKGTIETDRNLQTDNSIFFNNLTTALVFLKHFFGDKRTDDTIFVMI